MTRYVPLEEFLDMQPEEGTWLEWCAGLVYAMSGGSPEHSRLAARVVATLTRLLGDEDCTIFDSKADIWAEAAAFYGQADSTEFRDRGEKFEAYKLIPSLEEVVFVSQEERKIEVRRRGPKGWSCDVAGPADTTVLHGREITVAAIYG